MNEKITRRRLTICGEIVVYEEKIVEPGVEPGVERLGAPLPASMVDRCAVVVSALTKAVQRNESAGYQHMISSIKAVRALTGCGLKEAKSACESVKLARESIGA